ncbi:MAG: dihydropteroate synthase [Armatimonadia bacterium]|nr:dihydropteroate synthase [Armatimonadia bacterium]
MSETGRMSHRARVLDVPGRDAMVDEMGKVGVYPTAAPWMAAKARTHAVRVEGVPGPAAALLKQEMLALGGDCAVHRRVADFNAEPAAVIALGDARTFERLAERATQQPHGLAEIAGEVLAAVTAAADEGPRTLDCAGTAVEIGRRTLVMGIVNVTPASFSGDGLESDVDSAVEQARKFVEAGCDILDVGGESTRPGSEGVDVDEELERVLPVVEALADEFDAVISIDTSKPEVAQLSVAMGAGMINDVNGLRAAGMTEVVAETGAAACIMHMQGSPRDMQDEPAYDDLMTDIYDFLAGRIEAAEEAGVERERLLVDPGFGFGKPVAHNLEILRRLRELRSLGCRVLVGTSRKSTIGKVLDDSPVEERIMGTAATCAVAIANGADVIRVHDVAEMAQVARMTDAIVRSGRDAS